MSSRKKCSCSHCKTCGFPASKIKAVDVCQTQPVLPPPPASTPSYGNFFQTGFQTLTTNQPMPWNRIGRTAGITLNPDTVTIEVAQAGDYYIDYYALVAFTSFTDITALMGIFINGSEVNPIQTRYGALNAEDDRNECTPISGGTIVFIPAGGRVQLRNVETTPLSTCDGGIPLAASINLIKIN